MYITNKSRAFRFGRLFIMDDGCKKRPRTHEALKISWMCPKKGAADTCDLENQLDVSAKGIRGHMKPEKTL
jgi:predicted ArsR family transcriptional regulator